MDKRECSLFMRIELDYVIRIRVVIRIRKRKGFLDLIHGFGFHAFIILL